MSSAHPTTAAAAPDATATRAVPPQHHAGKLWARTFAALYDRLMASSEKAEMGARRRALLAKARGRTVEIGAGTGLNVEHYPDGVELLLTEPDAEMAKRLRARLAASGAAVDAGPKTRRIEVAEAHAEVLPVADASVDTAVATLVLCTVPQPRLALDELARALRPGGRLLFIEHVRAAPGTLRARAQDALKAPWKRFACGCSPNRDTEALLRGHPAFEIARIERTTWAKGGFLVQPLIVGEAVRRA